MLVTAQAHCNSWLCALAVTLLRYDTGILPSVTTKLFLTQGYFLTAYSLSLSALFHTVGFSLHLYLSQLDCNFCKLSLLLAPFFLLSAIVFQLYYKLKFMYALLRGWALGEGAIKQKDNTFRLFFAYMFLMTGDLQFFNSFLISLYCCLFMNLDNELTECSVIINV